MNYVAIFICSAIGYAVGFLACNYLRFRQINRAVTEMEHATRFYNRALKRVKGRMVG